MKQQPFEQQHAPFWAALESDLQELERDRKLPAERARDFPARYRGLCQHLALARARHYSPQLTARLNSLALRGHQQLYRTRHPFWSGIAGFLVRGFPQAVRAEAGLFWLALALFALPLIGIGYGCYSHPELIYSLMAPGQVDEMERMYDPASRVLGREREADSDVLMFGYYLMHNTGLGFQTFAGGLLWGIGTLFYLVYNGLAIGAVAGHLTRLGFTDTFWPFVVGHGAFELTAIVLAGQAGLKFGLALIAPGRHTRAGALKAAAPGGIRIVTGSALFFLVAAFIEAFWSSSTAVPIALKYTVAAGLWLLVITYLSLGGRARGA